MQPTERHTGYVLLLSMCVLQLPACLPCNSCSLQRLQAVVAGGNSYTAAHATQDTTWICAVTQHWSSSPCADSRPNAHAPAVSQNHHTCPVCRHELPADEVRQPAPEGAEAGAGGLTVQIAPGVFLRMAPGGMPDLVVRPLHIPCVLCCGIWNATRFIRSAALRARKSPTACLKHTR